MEKEFKWFISWMVFCVVLALSTIGFGIWVIIKLLSFWGII